MALKGKWTDKTDGIDIASAEDINSVAHAVMDLEDEIENVSGVYVGSGEMPEGYNIQVDPNGDATLVEVGDVVTLDSGEDAYVTSKNEDGQVVLNFGIPRGEKGEGSDRTWSYYKKITLPEGTMKVAPEFPAGTYKEMLVRVKCKFTKADGAGSFYISLGDVGDKGAHVRISSSIAANKNYYYAVEGKSVGGYNDDGKFVGYPVYYVAGSDSGYNGTTVSTNLNPASVMSSSEYLPTFAIYTSTDKVIFAENSTFEIWGR